jgi:hypothetical protein
MGDDTYLHNVHNERLLQQGVGVENFGCGSLHATMMNVWLVTDRAESGEITKISKYCSPSKDTGAACQEDSPPQNKTKAIFPPFFFSLPISIDALNAHQIELRFDDEIGI